MNMYRCEYGGCDNGVCAHKEKHEHTKSCNNKCRDETVCQLVIDNFIKEGYVRKTSLDSTRDFLISHNKIGPYQVKVKVTLEILSEPKYCSECGKEENCC